MKQSMLILLTGLAVMVLVLAIQAQKADAGAGESMQHATEPGLLK